MATRQNAPEVAEQRNAFARFILHSLVICLLSLADAKRVNQRSASKSNGFRPQRSKKASHLIKARGPPNDLSMTSQVVKPCETRLKAVFLLLSALLSWAAIVPAQAADEPDLIFRRSTVFKLLSPNDKLATYGVDDPEIEGVACHFTVPEKGGYAGWLGLSEQVSDISLACRQIGPIHFKGKLSQGDDMFRQRRSMFFKKMQIVRGCDAKRNTLVYMVYTDKLIEGSPKNSTSTVPIMPWGSGDAIQKCGDFIQ